MNVESPATRVVRFMLSLQARYPQPEDDDLIGLRGWCADLYDEWKQRGLAFDEANREALTAVVAAILTDYPDLPKTPSEA